VTLNLNGTGESFSAEWIDVEAHRAIRVEPLHGGGDWSLCVSMRDTAPSQDTALADFNQLSRRDILQAGRMSVCVRRKLRAVGRPSPLLWGCLDLCSNPALVVSRLQWSAAPTS